jgi:hypothetical protein
MLILIGTIADLALLYFLVKGWMAKWKQEKIKWEQLKTK